MAALLSLAVLTAVADAAKISTTLPKIDFEALGQTAVIGNFAGIQVYDAAYQAALEKAQVSDDRATIWARSPQGDLLPLGSTDIGGSINAVCQHTNGLVYAAGNFTSLGSVQAASIASYEPSTHTFAALADGLDGQVLALSCDDDTNTLYVGGSFQGPVNGGSEYTGSVASWSFEDSQWSPLPFGGLDGSVNAILPAGDADSSRSIFFGGDFNIAISNSPQSASGPSSPTIPSLGSSLSPISLNTSYVWAGAGQASGDPYTALCPTGDGTSGSNWLAPDNSAAIFVVRTYEPLQARGIRIGNIFADGRATTQFKLLTVPDSIVRTLSYYSDPSDPASDIVTCQWECPLSTNASIPYQDFLFDESLDITGFQLDVDAWQGPGGGFHQVSLLSDGAFAFAVNALNGNASTTCGMVVAVNAPASAEVSGDWTQQTVPSSIDGVDTEVLVATVPAGSTQSPSITFMPYIVAEGDYEAYLLTPKCSNMGDCSQRTTVDVSINPGPGQGSSTVSTIDQTNTVDASQLVYNGTLTAGATFTLQLSSDPSGRVSSGEYQIVAQKIQLVALSTNGTPLNGRKNGRGLFEYIPSSSFGIFGDGSATTVTDLVGSSLANASGFDDLSLALQSGDSISAFAFANNAIFYAGAFNASGNISTANVGVYFGQNPMSLAVPNGGLNGRVQALLSVGDYLYVAGDFDGSSDSAVGGLGGLARWKHTSESATWEALSSGNIVIKAGSVIGLAQGKITGSDHDAVLVYGSDTVFAVFDATQGEWASSDSVFVVGTVSSASDVASSDDGTTYIAGTIAAALKYSASGSAELSSNASGYPTLTPFDLPFERASQNSASQTSRRMKSKTDVGGEEKANSLTTLFAKTTAFLTSRQVVDAPAKTLPTPLNLDSEDAILSGAFYKNKTSGDDVTIFGGQFSTRSAQNIAVYDDKQKSISGLDQSLVLDGPVTALEVSKDTLYVGGSFTGALAVYDLEQGQWSSSPPGLSGYSGQNATVNVIAVSPTEQNSSSSVVFAGSFATAGSLTCNSICVWDAANTRWNALGTGLLGVVGAIDFAGNAARYIYAAGDFAVNGGQNRGYVARWDSQQMQWSLIGDQSQFTGPATAIAADDFDENNVFVAGGTNTPYLMRWNGTVWTNADSDSTLQDGSVVSQIAFVPLQASSRKSDLSNDDVMESNRMLMLNGAISLASIQGGQLSSVLFNGDSFVPFLTSVTASGAAAGASAAFIYSAASFRLSRHNLSVGIVILISIAIALGVVFLLVLIGLLFALRHRDSQESKAHASYPVGVPYADKTPEKTKQRPTSLLATLNAATARVASGNQDARRTVHDNASREHSPVASPRSIYHSDNEEEDDAMAGAIGYPSGRTSDYGEDADIVRTRYSFEAENQGEINVEANEEIKILDRSDENWYFVQKQNGERGVS